MKCMSLVWAAAMSACAATGSRVEAQSNDLDARVRQFNRTSPLIEVSTIGESGQERPIHLVRLGAPAARGEAGPDERPALLIVAGANGDHRVGTEVALGLIERLTSDHAKLLEKTTVYLVPQLNPDAAAAHEGAVRQPWSRTLTPDDADGDGRVDEDGADDVNGDGVISMMRIKHPPSWMKAEFVADGDEPRLMRAPKPEEGEIAEYAVLVESVDDDGDGKFAEDGVGGVELDRNFMHQWPEHKDGAGLYPLSEPESLALVTWMLERPNIAAVLVFGPHDTLVDIPTAGKMDITGEAPVGIEEGDKALYQKISEVFKEITKIKSAPNVDSAGALHAWAYAQFSVPSFSTPVWARPDQLESEKKKDDESAGKPEAEKSNADGTGVASESSKDESLTTAQIQAMVEEYQNADEARQAAMEAEYRNFSPTLQRRIMAIMEGRPDPAAEAKTSDQAKSKSKKGKANEDELAWLKYSDELRDGEGFIEWVEVDHPQLGKVEVGGFAPGFRMNPPQEELARLADEQTKFAVELLERLPQVRLTEPQVERVGAGVWRVRLEAVNEGYFPTMLAIAKKTRRLGGIVMQMDLPEESILAGDKTQITRGIDGSGGRAAAEWLIRAADGESVKVIVRSPLIGEQRLDVALESSDANGETR